MMVTTNGFQLDKKDGKREVTVCSFTSHPDVL